MSVGYNFDEFLGSYVLNSYLGSEIVKVYDGGCSVKRTFHVASCPELEEILTRFKEAAEGLEATFVTFTCVKSEYEASPYLEAINVQGYRARTPDDLAIVSQQEKTAKEDRKKYLIKEIAKMQEELKKD